MSTVEISLLGIGAVKLHSEQTVIYIDAFSELVKLPRVEKADLILVTHADGDHFEPQETARVAMETGALIVGPPGIAYPLLANTSLPARQLRIIYPIHFKKPVCEDVRGVKLKVYQTRHFNDWEPDHISFLVELKDKKFYITGDSYMIDEADPGLQQLDGIVYSLVMDSASAGAVQAHVAALEKVQNEFAPRHLIPNHLLHCQWTIDPVVLRAAVSEKGLVGVIILEDEKQVFAI